MSGDGPKTPLKETQIRFADEDDKSEDGSVGKKRKSWRTLERLKNINWAVWLKYVSLVVLVAQNTGQVLIMRYASDREGPKFIKTVAVFFNEIVKLVAALMLLTISNGSVIKTLMDLRQYFVYNLMDTLKVSVPAFIYTIQNFLLYVAIEHLDAGTYMVTYQLKILTTALFTVLMLRRRLSVPQWLSLVVLCMGVATVQYSAQSNKDVAKAHKFAENTTMTPLEEGNLNASIAIIFPTTESVTTSTPAPLLQSITLAPRPVQNPIIGFAAVITACFLSGFAGIYFEKILKGSDVSLWLRNVQLASLSIPIGMVVIGIKDREKVMSDGLMVGFDWVVWSVVLLQALGGLVVAVVIKYADNILKAFATSIAIVVSCVASFLLFGVEPKNLFIAGAALVIGAVVIYGIFPYRAKKKSASEDPEGEKANGAELTNVDGAKLLDKKA